jgi:hypothetical protein
MSEPDSQDIAEQGLPEEVADAWVTVLMDIWEKDEAAAKQAQANTPTEEGDSSCPTT